MQKKTGILLWMVIAIVFGKIPQTNNGSSDPTTMQSWAPAFIIPQAKLMAGGKM
jgi:hypothetical protein